MKYEIVPSNQFRKDLRLAQKRGYDLEKRLLLRLQTVKHLRLNIVIIC